MKKIIGSWYRSSWSFGTIMVFGIHNLMGGKVGRLA